VHRRVRKSEVIHGPEAPAARPPRRPPRLLRGRGPGHAGGGRGAAPLRRPVYVRHEIVHNRTVVERLKAQGAVFVEELDEVPVAAQVVFSAHGVPKSVRAELVVVIGSPNSHNSQRLREVAERAPAPAVPPCCLARIRWTGRRWTGSAPSASPPVPVRPRPWCRSCSAGLPSATR
jgi:hypothetical protein